MSNANQLSTLPVQANWKAAAGGAPARGAVEFPLYSDVSFAGEIRHEDWPYWFVNTLASPRSTPDVAAPVVVRLFVHTDYSDSHFYPRETTTTLYHGGWIYEEIAALASLALGRRFRAGGISRRFNRQDPWGTPMTTNGRERPAFVVHPLRAVLPDVLERGDLRELSPRLQSLLDLNTEDCVALVRAARLYQDALWIAESDANLAWLMLISALETASNRWREESGTPSEHLLELKPRLARKLQDVGGDPLVEFAAKELSHLLGATKKFVSFVLEHCPEPPTTRPADPALQVNWSPSNLRRVLKTAYEYRSKALHGGTPFPAPMCQAPILVRFGDAPVELGTFGIGAGDLGGYWNIEDLPISLNTFHHLARGALLRWWDLLAQPGRNNRLADQAYMPT